MAQTEDVDYSTVDEFATPDDDNKSVDPDQPNKSILIQLSKDIARDIKAHSGFDILNLPINATPEQKIAVFNEIAIHKGVAMNLKKYQSMINNKIKELK